MTKRLLELFCGTGSVGHVAKTLGYEVTSIDIQTHRGCPSPDIQTDILDWDYRRSPFPQKHFTVIWASPPCTSYARMQHINLGRKVKNTGEVFTKELWERRKTEADKLVQRALDIMEYFQPGTWILENPQTGDLKNRSIMNDIPFVDVDYCQYGMPYRKRTRLWTNTNPAVLKPRMCPGKGKCQQMIGRRHKKITVNGSDRGIFNCGTTTLDRYRIPQQLVKELLMTHQRTEHK
jgi:hypothetical protein